MIRKLLLIVGLCWTGLAVAQFTPGQVLSAAQLNSQFALYSKLAGATFTGPVSLPSGSAVSGYLTSATAASTYAPLASPVFTGSPVVPGYLTTGSASGTYAPLASPTFTGTVTVPTGFNVTNLSGQANFNINGASSNSRQFQFQTLGSNRWTIATDQTAEAGGNLGSDFGIYNFDNTGTFLSNPLKIFRNSGQAFFTVRPVFNGNTPYDSGNLTIANYALLASPTFTGTVTTAALTSTGAITPSQTAGIVGTTTNNNANAGSVGEFISSTVLAGSAVPLTANVAANVTSISLTPGDWDVWANVCTNPGATTAQSTVQSAITTVSATFPTAPNGGAFALSPYTNIAVGLPNCQVTGQLRASLSSTTTYFLVISSNFATSTNSGYGFIGARRAR